MRPTKDIHDAKLTSVKKKWKEKYFAAGVHHEEVEATTAAFSAACFDGKLELWEHVGNVLGAMQERASDLDLDGRLAAGAP